jgi:hypothetical protein
MLLELLKTRLGDSDTVAVQVGTLKNLLYELFGTANAITPSGTSTVAAIGSNFPAAAVSPSTVVMMQSIDASNTNSAASSPANLKSFAVPAGTLGLNTAAAPGPRGIWYYASGTTSAAANTKQIQIAFGGSTAVSIVPVATTVVSPWGCWGTVLVRTVASGANSVVVLSGQGGTCKSDGTSFQGGGANVVVSSLDLSTALTLQFSGTSAAAGAGDTVQNSLMVGYIL